MTLDPEKITTLIAQLEKEYQVIEENWDLNRRAWERIHQGADDILDWSALGYTLHVVYTSIENYFLRISKFFENDLSKDSWHKELLDRMELELPGIRPAFVDRETAQLLNELRGFRHVFRTLYDERLDIDRMKLLQNKTQRMREGFQQSHKTFIRKITELVE